MTEYVAVLHGRHDSIVDMQIGATDGTSRDLYDRVSGLLDGGLCDITASDVALAMPSQRFHGAISGDWRQSEVVSKSLDVLKVPEGRQESRQGQSDASDRTLPRQAPKLIISGMTSSSRQPRRIFQQRS
jgi:hypothetical protein